EVEPCINGGVLALAAYFGRPTETSRAALSTSNSRRRLELRGAEEHSLLVPHDYLRIGGAARIRACCRARSRGRVLPTDGRRILATARPLPTAFDRRDCKSGVPRVGVPTSLPLRRTPRA